MAQDIVKSGENPSEIPSYKARTRAKEELFARNWVIDQNATRSYRAAGYKCSTDEVAGASGAQLLKRPRVRKLIDRLLSARASRLEVRADRVLEELQTIAYANMADFTTIQADGSIVTDFSKVTREQMAAVKECTVEEFMDGRGEDAREVRRIRFKLHDKFPALEKLYQHAVPRAVDHLGRDGNGAPTVIIIDIPRPGGGEPQTINVLPAQANGNTGNGHNGNGAGHP